MCRRTAFLLAGGALLALALLASACSDDQDDAQAPSPEEESPMTLQVTSSAFKAGAAIPTRYTCQGEDVSPPLAWTGAPAGVQSYALIMDDPDAPRGTWVHWVVYNLPPQTASLPEGIRADADLPGGALHGKNSWGRTDYGGPCPPSGTHRYFFKLYALDTPLDLKPGASKQDVLNAMNGHVLASGELMGTYKR